MSAAAALPLGLCALLAGSAGCNEDEAQQAFRQAASSSLQSAATSFFTGVVDGAFAVFDLGAEGQEDETPGTDDASGG